MKKINKYLPGSEAKLLVWLINFITKIGGHATVLGLTTGDVDSITKDSKYFTYVEAMLEAYKTMLNNIVGYKNLLMFLVVGEVLGTLPVMPDLGPIPDGVPAGFVNRLQKLVKKIKASPNYTEAIGKDLGIVAALSFIDLLTLMPVLKITKDAGKPQIKAKKGRTSGMDLYVDRGDGAGSVFLVRLFKLNFIDTYPLPTVAKEWKYRGIYVVDNENVGLMSAEVSVTVKAA